MVVFKNESSRIWQAEAAGQFFKSKPSKGKLEKVEGQFLKMNLAASNAKTRKSKVAKTDRQFFKS